MENDSGKCAGFVAGWRSEVGGQIGGRCYHSICAHRTHTAWQTNPCKLWFLRQYSALPRDRAGLWSRLALPRPVLHWLKLDTAE